MSMTLTTERNTNPLIDMRFIEEIERGGKKDGSGGRVGTKSFVKPHAKGHPIWLSKIGSWISLTLSHNCRFYRVIWGTEPQKGKRKSGNNMGGTTKKKKLNSPPIAQSLTPTCAVATPTFPSLFFIQNIGVYQKKEILDTLYFVWEKGIREGGWWNGR